MVCYSYHRIRIESCEWLYFSSMFFSFKDVIVFLSHWRREQNCTFITCSYLTWTMYLLLSSAFSGFQNNRKIPHSFCFAAFCFLDNLVYPLTFILCTIWLLRNVMIQVLDCVLGHNEALFRRAQLKALVSIHGQEVN